VIIKTPIAVLIVVLLSWTSLAQQRTGGLQGQVVDALGGVLIDAPVTLTSGTGVETSTNTDQKGAFAFSGIVPGQYTVRVTVPGFASESRTVDIRTDRPAILQFKLGIARNTQEVTVTADLAFPFNFENSATMLVLRGKALDALPEGPGGLAATLRLLSVRSASATGPQIIVNGFEGGRIPPKQSIREIRINQNPFSAQYDQPGMGRVEIFTKPGTDTLQGGIFTNFNDESVNSRNPFAPNRAPFQSRMFGGNVSGPIVPKRVSFFVDFERHESDENAVVNATVLDSDLNVQPFNISLLTPLRRTSFSPRLDYQIGVNNTLVMRYAHSRGHSSNLGVGEFSLPSRAYNTRDQDHTAQVTETAIINDSLINEMRFQYVRENRRQDAPNSMPVIRVGEAFTGGGSEIGISSRRMEKMELHNHTMWMKAKHALKAGGHVRRVTVADDSTWNFRGTFTFAGRVAPQLTPAGEVVYGPDGRPLPASITTLETYRRTLLLQRQNLSAEQIRARGGGPSQFSIVAGDPRASVGQYDAGFFLQDDWRLRPNFTLSSGLRYEIQNNIRSHVDLAPRLGLAWTPAGPDGKLVLRAGAGVFYDRFSHDLVLQARRLNGVSQRQYVVSDPKVLDYFPEVPPAELLGGFLLPPTIRRTDPTLRSPYMIQTNLSVERILPFGLSTAITYLKSQSMHLLRSRNINAPLPGTSTRPLPAGGEIFQYETSGRSDQNQLVINVVQRFQSKLSYYGTYILNRTTSDTDGPDSFPANSYDLTQEKGRSAQDARHTFYWGGWLTGPLNIELSPVVVLRSGSPFNITTGRDSNADTIFSERPAFAADISSSEIAQTSFGRFNLGPERGQTLIPRNFGQGPGFASVHLRIGRTFHLNPEQKGGTPANRRYPLTLAIQIQNLFNRTNADVPAGNLSSPLFGRSYASVGDYGFGKNSAGNRRIEAQVYLGF
jgi:hypothetical protein